MLNLAHNKFKVLGEDQIDNAKNILSGIGLTNDSQCGFLISIQFSMNLDQTFQATSFFTLQCLFDYEKKNLLKTNYTETCKNEYTMKVIP